MSSTVYLLSIGINDYQSEKIPNLKGSKSDVIKFEQTLIDLDLVQKDHCISLFNEKATRVNIIKTFRTHFDQLKDGDIAVLYFSGHGKSEPTSQEFIDHGIEPEYGKNENIVPHDSQKCVVFNIADKELRWLISEIQKEKKDTSFIAIFDCCHSGSILKDDNVRLKTCPMNELVRPLNSYLEDQYSKMLFQQNNISLPNINYILLAACSSEEQAWEDENGGIFTNAFIDFLKSRNGKITYSELNSLSHIQIRNERGYIQHPYLECTENANPFKYFLKNEVSPSTYLPSLIFGGNEWHVLLGAIHNIDSTYKGVQDIPIYRSSDFSNAIGMARLKKVFIDKSTVIPEWFSAPPDTYEKLYLGLYPQRIPFEVKLQNTESKLDQSVNQYFESEDFKGQFYITESAEYQIRIDQNGLCIFKVNEVEQTLIIGTKDFSERTLPWLNHQLRMIAKCKHLLKLRSNKNSKLTPQHISLSFNYWFPSEEKIQASRISAQETTQYVQIPLTQDKNAISYGLDVKHSYQSSNGLYFYLIHLDRKYCIKQKNENPSKPLKRNTKKNLYNSENHRVALGISDPKITSVEDHFILITADTPMTNASYFHQEGFADQFGKVIGITSINKSRSDGQDLADVEQNWCVKKLVIQLIRE